MRSSVLLVFLALSLTPALVRADDAPTRRAIQARYDQFDQLYMKKDFPGVAALFAPQCTLTLKSEGRSMAATRVVAGMKGLSGALTVAHARTRITSLKTVGDTAEVVAVWSADSTYTPRTKSREDNPRRKKITQTLHDTWRKSAGVWQIAHRVIEEEDEADAKPATKK